MLQSLQQTSGRFDVQSLSHCLQVTSRKLRLNWPRSWAKVGGLWAVREKWIPKHKKLAKQCKTHQNTEPGRITKCSRNTGGNHGHLWLLPGSDITCCSLGWSNKSCQMRNATRRSIEICPWHTDLVVSNSSLWILWIFLKYSKVVDTETTVLKGYQENDTERSFRICSYAMPCYCMPCYASDALNFTPWLPSAASLVLSSQLMSHLYMESCLRATRWGWVSFWQLNANAANRRDCFSLCHALPLTLFVWHQRRHWMALSII